MLHNTLLPLLISLLGLPIGYLFSFLAAEEIRPGEKYFIWLKRILLIMFLGVLGYGLVMEKRLLLLIILAIGGLVILGIEIIPKLIFKQNTTKQTRPRSWGLASYALPYAFFILAYFLLPSQQLLLASIIFLYGLPAGTMMRTI